MNIDLSKMTVKQLNNLNKRIKKESESRVVDKLKKEDVDEIKADIAKLNVFLEKKHSFEFTTNLDLKLYLNGGSLEIMYNNDDDEYRFEAMLLRRLRTAAKDKLANETQEAKIIWKNITKKIRAIAKKHNVNEWVVWDQVDPYFYIDAYQ